VAATSGMSTQKTFEDTQCLSWLCTIVPFIH